MVKDDIQGILLVYLHSYWKRKCLSAFYIFALYFITDEILTLGFPSFISMFFLFNGLKVYDFHLSSLSARTPEATILLLHGFSAGITDMYHHDVNNHCFFIMFWKVCHFFLSTFLLDPRIIYCYVSLLPGCWIFLVSFLLFLKILLNDNQKFLPKQ
jgi:hypothetical protein